VVFAASTQVVTDIHPVVALSAGLLIAGTVHLAKAGALRPAVTATTGGMANPVVSVLEDIVSTALSILSIVIPLLIGVILVPLAAWVTWLIWRRSNQAEARA
jgi:hypothetical protein